MHDDYSRLLLPETTEIAFATICGEIERQMAADRLRKVLAPAVVRATGAEGEISFSHPGYPYPLALPTDLGEWKRARMEEYGISAGYGLYAYSERISASGEDAVEACWEWIRSIEPEQAGVSAAEESIRKVYSAVASASAAVGKQFPHMGSILDGVGSLEMIGVADDIGCLCRKHRAVAVVDRQRFTVGLYLWWHESGRAVQVAEVSVGPLPALEGTVYVSRLAAVILHKKSAGEILPLPPR